MCLFGREADSSPAFRLKAPALYVYISQARLFSGNIFCQTGFDRLAKNRAFRSSASYALRTLLRKVRLRRCYNPLPRKTRCAEKVSSRILRFIHFDSLSIPQKSSLLLLCSFHFYYSELYLLFLSLSNCFLYFQLYLLVQFL